MSSVYVEWVKDKLNKACIAYATVPSIPDIELIRYRNGYADGITEVAEILAMPYDFWTFPLNRLLFTYATPSVAVRCNAALIRELLKATTDLVEVKATCDQTTSLVVACIEMLVSLHKQLYARFLQLDEHQVDAFTDALLISSECSYHWDSPQSIELSKACEDFLEIWNPIEFRLKLTL